MGRGTAEQLPYCIVGETRTPGYSFAGKLDSGELLTGTPTVVEQTTSDLTITNKVVNTTALTLNNEEVAIGQAVQFKISGQLLANSPYVIKITCGTDAGNTLIGYMRFEVDDD